MNNINGRQAVFNVFGDINQSLSKERSIKNWNHLLENFQGYYYEINENYRNTVQITKFCNGKFKYDHIPIGLEGPKVEYIDESKIEYIVNSILKKQEKTRIAIIKKNNIESLVKILGEYESLIDKSIVIGNVKRIKGLKD